MNKKVLSDFQKYIDVNIPIIYINDFDFARVDEIIQSVIGGKKVFEWNPATGTTDFVNRNSRGLGVEQSLVHFLREQYTIEIDESMPIREKFLVLREIQDYIDDPEIRTLLALIAQRKLYDRRFETTIIIVSSINKVPSEIAQYVTFLDIEYPHEEEINALINDHIEVNDYTSFEESDREKLMPSLQGLTAYEIDRILDMAMSNNGSLSAEDKEMILRQKKGMVKKSGLVELIDTPESLDSIGGLDDLKNYLKEKANIFHNLSEALKYGVSMPKGVFLVGMPGCGKSLCAKAAASIFEVPLLKLDMGSMMGKYVGQSEENLRKAIKIAEAAAPCILWIDEIEKAFSGVGGQNDAVLTRMFGNFLFWMQEKKSSVYVVATANNAESLPPELKRKGRFDEIFCVNLPTKEERKKIFYVHLNKLKGKACIDSNSSFDYEKLSEATSGFNGADIESVVHQTIEKCFLNNRSGVTTSDLMATAKKTLSITKSCKKQIDAMQSVFKESSFRDATTGKITSA